MSTFKIIAWNVNGIRALTKKENLQKYLDTYKPHVFCMGETMLYLDRFKQYVSDILFTYFLYEQGYLKTLKIYFSHKKYVKRMFFMSRT